MLTPLIGEPLTRDVQFLVGSNYNIILAQLRADAPQLEIYFACGAELSEEHPEMTRLELFHQADENMYQNKQQWYAEKKAREAQTAKGLRRNPQPQNMDPHDGYTGQNRGTCAICRIRVLFCILTPTGIRDKIKRVSPEFY